MSKIKIFTFFSVLLMLCIAGSSFYYTKKEPLVIHGVLLTEPKILSPFSLLSTESMYFTEKSLIGKWSFLFFGYANCPDICPTTLLLMNDLAKKLNRHTLHSSIQFVFVSLDPARDSVLALKKYVSHFNKNFIGATGNETELKNLTAQLGIPFFIQSVKTKPTAFDHGTMIALINPAGTYQAILTTPFTSDSLLTDFLKIASF